MRRPWSTAHAKTLPFARTVARIRTLRALGTGVSAILLLAMLWPDVPPRQRQSSPDHPLPPLDQWTLRRLAGDMHSSEAADRFAATYARMLPARVERISRALDIADDSEAMDAVLSLKISSAMVGALQMEQHCARLEDALARADRADAVAAGEDVRGHRADLGKALGRSAARHTST